MKAFFLFILVFFGGVVAAQREIDVQVLNVEHGLSQSVVNDMLVDSKGYLWAGTQNGLNRFDGYQFMVFNNDLHNRFSISSDFITSMAEDATDNLWIGTRTGLNKYESRTQRFIHYGLPSNKLEFPQINIRSLLVDSENFVWVLLPSYLVRINPVDEQMRVFGFSSEVYDSSHCTPRNLYESSSNNIWFVVGKQLVMFDKVFESFEVADFSSTPNIGCLNGVFEHEQTMYVTSEHFVWKVTSMESVRKIRGFQSKIGAFSVFEKQGKVRLVSNIGVFRIKNDSLSMQYRFRSTTGEQPHYFVSAAKIDDNENLWVGTSGKGILKANLSQPKFNSLTLKIAENQFLSDDQISAIYIDDEWYWVGTYEYGINLIHKQNKTVRHINVREHPELIGSDNIYDIRKIAGRYVIATDKGFSILRKKGGKLISEKHERLSIFRAQIYDILPVGNASMFYSYGGKLYEYNFNTAEMQHWTFDMDSETGLTNSFTMARVENDLLFIGTSYGLFRFDRRNQLWDRFLFDYNDTTSISGNDVYAINYSPSGRLWVGTSNGIDFIDDPFEQNLQFNHLTSLRELTIYSIVSDDVYTWIGTGNGLVRYTVADSSLNFFNKADGLPCNEFNIGASFVSNDRLIALGGQGGIVLFHSDSVQLSTYNPHIDVARAVIYNHHGKREVPVYSGVKLDLAVSDFLINIYFTSLDHTAPEKIQYRYKVNNSNWIDVGHQNYASFSNLQPGNYTIKINGTNADRQWSSNIAIIELYVPNPWYSRWWAYTIYFLILLVAILFGIETRTRRLRLTNQVLREKEASAKQVARQKDRLMMLHKNVTESIHYAGRIQRALFPANSTLKRILPYSFVMHRPKDIVSGDFYWVTEIDAKVCIAVVDCTGHGVPGALMSVIAVELLKQTIEKSGFLRPAEILGQVDSGLNKLFFTDEDSDIKDGMDMGICVIDRETLVMEFAGAIHSLYRVKGSSISELKGDRMPVGMAQSVDKFEYTNHFVEFESDDMFYMATDGYPDQFGGKRNKKYKYNRFRNFLISIADHDMDMQQLLLENNFDKWRGNLEQVDDVLVLGFRPLYGAS
ncbi:MAG: two-component regulator propeller domain-containing protein [Salinivirgaceae bacterium]